MWPDEGDMESISRMQLKQVLSDFTDFALCQFCKDPTIQFEDLYECLRDSLDAFIKEEQLLKKI